MCGCAATCSPSEKPQRQGRTRAAARQARLEPVLATENNRGYEEGERDDDEDGVGAGRCLRVVPLVDEWRTQSAECGAGAVCAGFVAGQVRPGCWARSLLPVLLLLVLVTLRHQEFEPMLGYPGEGPEHGLGTEEQVMVLEDVDTEDEWIEELAVEEEPAVPASVLGLWQGDDMSREYEEGGVVGTVGFFNIDGLLAGGTGMEEVVNEVERTNCMVMGLCDHRSDFVNVRSRVELAFASRFRPSKGEAKCSARYGGMRFAHSCTKDTRKVPSIGECSIAVMPALSARAEQPLRDCRGWGRYSGIVIMGKLVEKVQRKLAIITLYAPCGDESGAGKWQMGQIDSIDDTVAGVHRGSAIAMLLHDLDVLLKTKLEGCHVMIGGDWNQRHNSKRVFKQKQWCMLQAWMKKRGLVDVMQELHGNKCNAYYSYRNVGGKDKATGKRKVHRSRVDHCYVSQPMVTSGAILAAGISTRAQMGSSLHYMVSVEVDFRRVLGIESANAGAADVVDMEPRMPYIRNEKRRKEYSSAIKVGLLEADLPCRILLALAS